MRCDILLEINTATICYNLHNLKKLSGLQFFINGVKSQSIARPDHPGDQVRDLLDGVHLLSQVLGLQEVTEMGVVGVLGNLVQVQETLVDLMWT